jgi:hypothetical protein
VERAYAEPALKTTHGVTVPQRGSAQGRNICSNRVYPH